MEWFKKHVDTTIIITAIVASMLWMNGKFSDKYFPYPKEEEDEDES